MFSDEIAGNAARKRQDQAKARRRKLKEEQKKQQEKKDYPPEVMPAKTSAISSGESDHAPVQTEVDNNVGKPEVSGKSHAVKKALEQRRVRYNEKLSISSATAIQAAYRTYASNRKLVKEQKEILQKRVSDLVTLTKILSKQNNNYCPPPSLVNLLLHQMLFVMHSTSQFHIVKNEEKGILEKRFFSRISSSMGRTEANIVARLVEYAILPGLIIDDNHLDPAIVWLESKHGQLTFLKLIRLCLHLTTAKKKMTSKHNERMMHHVVAPYLASGEDLKVFYKIIEVLVIHGKDCASSEVVKFCQQHLFPTKSVIISKPFALGVNPIQLENLDLFQFIRSFLLFPSGKRVVVVPPNAEHERRQCISNADRLQGDGLFALALRIVEAKNDLNLASRVVSEFFTVPLFTWRIEQKSIDIIVGQDKIRERKHATLFVSFINAFIKRYQVDDLNDIQKVLPVDDVPLTICPAPSVLSLCANLVSLGTKCPLINGTDKSQFNFDDATLYFNFMSLLVEKVPLGAFSSRESEMGWIRKGSVLSPIVLSVVVRDQCKMLLLESFVREVFKIAADPEVIGTETVLSKKNAKDMKLEKELNAIKSQSATAVAAGESKIDRSTGFWKKSKWAKKLASFLGGDESNSSKGSGSIGNGALLNTSAVSRDLAKGQMKINRVSGDKTDTKSPRAKNIDAHVKFTFALTRTYAIIMSRWGGGGRDIIGSSESHSTNKTHMDKADPLVTPFLNVLCFSTPFIRTAWALIQSNPIIITDLHDLVDAKKCSTPIRTRTLHASFTNGILSNEENAGSAFLLLGLAAFAHALIVTDDTELHELDSPLPTHHTRRCILLLKSLMYRACCLDPMNCDPVESNHVGLSIISFSAKIMIDLYDRSSRRLLCPPNLWLIDDLLEDEIRRCKVHEDYCELLNRPVLKVCPFLVSFKRRLKLFERITTTSRESIQGRNDGHSFRPGIHVHIMRGRVLEDGLIHLNKLGSNLRRRIIVQYVNSAGSSESGLDAGGLFKEFWTDLSNHSFDPNWALFKETEDGCLYPNPSSRVAHGSDSILLFEFLGRILGKAIYEHITIKPQFAHFFLSFLRGDYNFLHMLSDLSTMDRTLYNNLMFLKTYEGDAKDLCLTFAVAKDDFGNNEEIPLVTGGRDMEVSNLNKHRYIGLVAKHYVHDRVKEQSEAFRRGLWDVIDKKWLRIFNEPELQVVISGPTNGSIDVEDLKANAKLTGGYTIFDSQIRRFWRVVSSFDDHQRADLLRFVTSCERPPPLGFASMNPPFTIQRVPISSDGDKLPTASTCFNILKLPTYSSEKMLKDRLLYSIQSGSGFELT